jgi:hypothetical protein
MNHSAALSVVFLLFAVVAAPGCYEGNSAYDPDAPQSCKSPAPLCPAAAPICADDNVCVQCTPANQNACTGTTPICGTDRACHACNSNDQCESKACLPSGACAKVNDVAYVMDAAPGAPPCDLASPCGTLSLALQSTKTIIKIGAGLFKPNESVLIERSMIILGEQGTKPGEPATVLDRNLDGPILEIKGKSGSTTKVLIANVKITGSAMGNAVEITANGSSPTVTLDRVSIVENQGLGIRAIDSTLQVYRSRINDNINGGISLMSTSFQIIGNFFFSNGDSAKLIGGIQIMTLQNNENRLEFNSFHKNEALAGNGTAIQCSAGTFTARNNILFDNVTGSNTTQTGGSCAHSFSIVFPGPAPTTGSSNYMVDPVFASGGNTPDLSLSATSPARGKADPESDLTGEARFDLNGTERKKPADIGADQTP